MPDTLTEKARTVRDLRIIQRRLATGGYHDDAVKLRTQIQPHRAQVVLAYLGVNELPDTVNATLVGEIAEVAATMATPAETEKLRSLLRRAAQNDLVETTRMLFHAKTQLPNLQKVESALSTVKE